MESENCFEYKNIEYSDVCTPVGAKTPVDVQISQSVYYRSTSPNTISCVPMIVTTSASI